MELQVCIIPSVKARIKNSVSDPYSLNPDPAKNPDPYLSSNTLKNNKLMIIRFSYQKKSIE